MKRRVPWFSCDDGFDIYNPSLQDPFIDVSDNGPIRVEKGSNQKVLPPLNKLRLI